MKKILLPYVIVPAILLIAVTAVRAWFEVEDPEHAMTKMLSALILSVVWMLVMPAVMLRKGLSLGSALLAAFIFFVLHRAAIGTVYAMAWADKWTVTGTEQPVRYVAQIEEQMPEASPLIVFLANTFAPSAAGLVIVFVIWTISWLIGFRDKRPLARAPAAT